MADEATAALVSLRRIVRFLRLAERKAEIACGLSVAQLFVLETLAAAPKSSQAELAARTLTDQSSVSVVVTKLVARGLVSRSVSPTDRRRIELALTSLGQRTLARAPRIPQATIIASIRSMPPTRRAELVRSLAHLASSIGADEVAPRMLFDEEPPKKRV